MAEENKTAQEKIDPRDPSLDLADTPTLNKKSLKLIFVGFASVLLIAVMAAFAPQNAKATAEEEEQRTGFGLEIPDSVNIFEDDYYTPEKQEEAEPEIEPIQVASAEEPDTLVQPDAVEYTGRKSNEDQYRTYDRTQPQEQREAEATDSQPEPRVQYTPQGERSRDGYLNSATSSNSDRREQQALEQQRRSPLFFSGQYDHGASEEVSTSAANGRNEAIMEGMKAANASESDKQNMQSEKREFLEAQRRSQPHYLDARYTKPVDETRELKAGTVVPMVMLTGINSDLPGQIVAQVLVDVYDTITGQNILIPKGSKLIGHYDSSVAFGQQRALIAWNRLLRTDGVSLDLRGMPGVDRRGIAGLKDKVDTHLDEIIAAITASSGIDFGINFLTALGADAIGLDSLSKSMEDSGKKTAEIVEGLFNKYIQQQPTIHIRPGFRGNLLITQDVILPPVDDWGF